MNERTPERKREDLYHLLLCPLGLLLPWKWSRVYWLVSSSLMDPGDMALVSDRYTRKQCNIFTVPYLPDAAMIYVFIEDTLAVDLLPISPTCATSRK